MAPQLLLLMPYYINKKNNTTWCIYKHFERSISVIVFSFPLWYLINTCTDLYCYTFSMLSSWTKSQLLFSLLSPDSRQIQRHVSSQHLILTPWWGFRQQNSGYYVWPTESRPRKLSILLKRRQGWKRQIILHFYRCQHALKIWGDWTCQVCCSDCICILLSQSIFFMEALLWGSASDCSNRPSSVAILPLLLDRESTSVLLGLRDKYSPRKTSTRLGKPGGRITWQLFKGHSLYH